MLRILKGEEVEKIVDDFDIIDVRTEFEYNMGHIKNAINIPYDEILENLDKIDKNKPTLIYCRSNRRSEIAYLCLTSAGFSNIYVGDGVSFYDYNLVR